MTEQDKNTEDVIIGLLESTNREGMIYLIGYLQESGFFEGIASARGHGSYKGGLATHSLRVYELMLRLNVNVLNLDVTISPSQKAHPIKPENIIIAALLHDTCKIEAYVRTKADDGWTNNRNKEKGHALLSIKRIKKYIKLTELEEKMIKYHMGVYGLKEFDEKSGEYELRNKQMANAWYHDPICKVIYFCDELATLEEKLVKYKGEKE